MKNVIQIAGLLCLPITFGSLAIYIKDDNNFNVTNFFFYFTTLTNLLVGSFYLIRQLKPGFQINKLRGGLLLYSVVTILGFWVALGAKFDTNNSVNQIFISLLHSLCLIILTLDLIITPLKTRLFLRDIMPWICLPILYFIIILIRGSIVNWYPYPFLNPQTSNSLYLMLILTPALILLSFIIFKLENSKVH